MLLIGKIIVKFKDIKKCLVLEITTKIVLGIIKIVKNERIIDIKQSI